MDRTNVDRTKCPLISPVSGVDFPKAVVRPLANGAILHELPFCEEEIVRVDCLFKAGSVHQSHLLEASFAGQLLNEGTSRHSSAEVAEMLDSYGAMLNVSVSYENACVTLHSLKRHLEPMLRLLSEIITDPLYGEKEFVTYLNKRKQQYLIQQEKVTTLASRNMNAALYGPKSLYGTVAQLSDYDQLNVAWIRNFHRKRYVMRGCDIILSGKVDDAVRRVMEQTLGSIQTADPAPLPDSIYEWNELNKTYCFYEKAESVQSAIYMGRKVMSAKDPRFHQFSVLNTLLGGYFGSRLMMNIREEKGYTYGIGSYLLTQPQSGRFIISTQTATQFVEPTLAEIEKELKKLRETPVSEDELNEVRSYMLGENARVVDGSFSFVDAYISFLALGVEGNEFYKESSRSILSVTSKDLMELANQYFDRSQFCVSVAGKKVEG